GNATRRSMKRDAEILQAPPKLVDTPYAYAELLSRGNHEFATSTDETERFCRAHARARPRSRVGALLLAPAGVVATAAFVVLLLQIVTSRPPQQQRGASISASGSAAPGLHRPPNVPAASEPGPVALAAGERRLDDGSVVRLSPEGAARLVERGKSVSIVLERGRVSLAVEPRRADAELEVSAGAFRFRVVGTRFSVTRAGAEVALRVDEGRVAVFGERGELAMVGAGGDWSSAEPEPSASAGPSAARATPPSTPPRPAPDCRELARDGEAKRAEDCYLERSAGVGLEAETALLEVARLRRDVLADPSGALSALERYRVRFPNGSLRGEADIARVVLLSRLGRPRDALAESQRLLDSPNGSERAFELRLLRGNVYRKGLGDTALAAAEYAKAETLEGAGAEAAYLLGSCLEELGDDEGASSAYRRYLAKSPKGKRADDVRRRLERSSSP
ncbi:MAG TPA: FecR family protein, partial [Polyangiaceae bacterium]